MKGVGDKIGLEAMPGVDAYVRERNLEVPPLDQPLIPDDLHYAGYSWTQDILVIAMPGIIYLRFRNRDITYKEKLYSPDISYVRFL